MSKSHRPDIIIFALAATACLLSTPVNAHVSEQGFVLLLPTTLYIASGVAAVVLTLLLLALLPASASAKLFCSRILCRVPGWSKARNYTSLISLGFLVMLLIIGVIGSRDPLKNPLPLYIWTLWWVGLVAVHGVVGNVWHWMNPWSGLFNLLGGKQKTRAGILLEKSGASLAIVSLLVFIGFTLAYPAPDDPDRLAFIVFAYWVYTFIAMWVFGGQCWFECGEFTHWVMNFFARLSPFSLHKQQLIVGLPGFRAYQHPDKRITLSVFVLLLLGCGSFDGLNETFWWLAVIDVNPLEFPGRSDIVAETIFGIAFANILLISLFALCIWLGVQLVAWYEHRRARSVAHRQSTLLDNVTTKQLFTQLGISMLPIAFAYHIAHYLVSFLINIQYTFAASSDPLARGDDLLGLGTFYVTTGFLNTHHSVQILWLFQAGVVVIGHILSLLLAHAIAMRLYKNSRQAMLSQVPLASFMILYTLLGLWLLAAPKGA